MIKFNTLYKLLQRKCYDILSLQYAFLLILVSCFLFFMSLVQFGEAWLDWSRNKYEALFSTFSDNIVGKSFQQQLCHKVPIDVVYTWVNGSDPLFLKNLHQLTKSKEEEAALNESFASRFEDLEELRYSLRSLEMYAPWVHHVFLVTNGQIPYWLDMDHPRLTVVTHSEIFLNQSHLPTFSSPAIESHLHRIPGLSKYFLYMNDDIILGKSVWPEDFLTESEGYKIFVTWNLPECSTMCTWSWVGDGSCDPPCNIEECSFDGGDCNSINNKYPKYEYNAPNGPLYQSGYDAEMEKEIKFAEEYYQMLNRNVPSSSSKDNIVNKTALSGNETELSLHHERRLLAKDVRESEPVDESVLIVKNRSSRSRINVNYLYNGGMKHMNVKNEILSAFKRGGQNVSVSELVRTNNRKWMRNNRLMRKMRRNFRKTKERSVSPPKNYLKFKFDNDTYGKLEIDRRLTRRDSPVSVKTSIKGNSTNSSYSHLRIDGNVNLLGAERVLDMFAESLLHVNRLYNNAFGVSHRKVLAHMPHFINKEIMVELQNTFPREWNDTSSHRLRSKKDMQFAFSYFYYIVGQKIARDVGDMFDEFDTDGSGTWSDREVRTLLTRVYAVPLSYPIVLEFEEFITNCSRKYSGPAEEVVTPMYERYSDSKLPTITKPLIENCPSIIEMLREHFGMHPKYKYQLVKDMQQDVSFKMITSNLSKVIESLDVIRSHPRKFICLNNNMDANHDERENDIVKAVVQDFYQSLYPRKSSFELSSQYRNRFLYVEDLRQWKRDRDNVNFLLLFLFFVVGSATFFCVCQAELRLSYRKVMHLFRHRDSSHALINYGGRRTISQI